MNSHEIDYEILGSSLQGVEITLDPGETVIAEAGSLIFMTADVGFEARLGDGSESGIFGKLFGAAKRMFTNESVFITHFTQNGADRGQVAFAAPYPGTIVPVDLAAADGEVICQRDAFLCAAKGTRLSVAFSKRLGAGFFGGEGFILQKLSGDGLAFMHAGGTVIERELNGDTLKVDTGCLVGFTGGIDYGISMAGGLRSMLFGGEGLFMATLTGTGKVWLQTMPFSRLADRILENAPRIGGAEKGEN